MSKRDVEKKKIEHTRYNEEYTSDLFDNFILPRWPLIDKFLLYTNVVIVSGLINTIRLHLNRSKLTDATSDKSKIKRIYSFRQVASSQPAPEVDHKEITGRGLCICLWMPSIYWLYLLIECMNLSRYMFCIVRLSPLNTKPKQVKLSCIYNIWTTEVPIETLQLSDYHGVRLEKIDHLSSGCKMSIISSLAQRYQGFMWRNSSSRGLLNDDIEDYLLFEQNLGNLFHDESIIVDTILAIFLGVCGIAATIFSIYRPYEVPAIEYICMPEHSLLRYRYKFNKYLKQLRFSYRTFCDYYTFESRHKQGLTTKEEPTGGDELDESFHTCENIETYFSDYHYYRPRARSQAWRRVLLMIQPIFGLYMFLSLTWLIDFAYMKTHFQNSAVLERNLEIRRLLREESLPLEASAGFEDVIRNCNSNTSSLGLMLSEAIADIVRTNTKQANLLEPMDSNHQYRKYLAEFLDPIKKPEWISWRIGQLGLVSTTALTTMFYLILLLSITDLCFVLAEIVIKLSICVFILQQYSEQCKLLGQSQNVLTWRYCPGVTSSYLDSLPEDLPDQIEEDALLQPRFRRKSRVAIQTDVSSSIPVSEIFRFVFRRSSENIGFCKDYADKLTQLDSISKPLSSIKLASHKFLVTSYLDFRLFLDQIDRSRRLMDYMITFAVFNSFCLNFGATRSRDTVLRISLLIAALTILNVTVLLASHFQSSCQKLYLPIHSILAAGSKVQNDLSVQHLTTLWRKALVDFTGQRTKLCFRVYSFNLSYATALQVTYNFQSRCFSTAT